MQRAAGNRAALGALAPEGQNAGQSIHQVAQQGVAGPGGPLPHFPAIQRSFGRHDLARIQAHTGGPAAEQARAMGAAAYATGEHIAFARHPSLRSAAHEAAHVVQQRAGVDLPGGIGTAGDACERHADQVADRVVHGESAEALLDAHPMAGRGGQGQVAPFGAGSRPAVQMETEEHAEREDRLSFVTSSPGHNILRRRQALVHNKEYGRYLRLQKKDGFDDVKCSAVSLLRILRDYGLVPPDMSFEEFQNAFVTAAPGSIFVNKVDQKVPGKDMFTPVIAAATRAGAKISGSLLGDGLIDEADPENGAGILARSVVEAFRDLAQKEEYAFLIHPAITGFHGAECNTVALLYMLQSYGLVPPDMRLEEFEEAFTPVDVSKRVGAGSSRKPAGSIFVNGVDQHVPGVDLFTPIVGSAEQANAQIRGAFRLGGHKVNPLIDPFNPKGAGELIRRVLLAFKHLGEREEYAFLRQSKYLTNANTSARVEDEETKKIRWFNATRASAPITGNIRTVHLGEQLERGAVPAAYFKRGHTIVAGINEHYKPRDITHYILITGLVGSFRHPAGDVFTIYMADDPFYGRVYVLAHAGEQSDFIAADDRFSRSDEYRGKYAFTPPGMDPLPVFPLRRFAIGLSDASLLPLR